MGTLDFAGKDMLFGFILNNNVTVVFLVSKSMFEMFVAPNIALNMLLASILAHGKYFTTVLIDILHNLSYISNFR